MAERIDHAQLVKQSEQLRHDAEVNIQKARELIEVSQKMVEHAKDLKRVLESREYVAG
jgi:hypothetical protein